MSVCMNIVSIILLTATLAMAADSPPPAEPSAAASVEPITDGVPINNGFVIVKGQYVPLPYVVGTRGEELFLNGQPISTERLYVRGWGRWGGRGFHRSWRRGPERPEPSEENEKKESEADEEPPSTRRWYVNHAARLERHLQGNGLLVVFEDETANILTSGNDTSVLKILLSDKPREEKLEALVKIHTRHIESARWIELVDSLQPSDELTARVNKIEEKQAVAVNRPNKAPPIRLSSFIKYGITLSGIILGAVALGTLLNHRPKSQVAWSDVDTAGDSIPMVVRNVILVAVLGFFDLGCTLLAQNSIGFVEINPLGSSLVNNPTMLAIFKIIPFAIACVILLSLRRYRGAQIASWWLCLVCTILTFRWATYGTMCMA